MTQPPPVPLKLEEDPQKPVRTEIGGIGQLESDTEGNDSEDEYQDGEVDIFDGPEYDYKAHSEQICATDAMKIYHRKLPDLLWHNTPRSVVAGSYTFRFISSPLARQSPELLISSLKAPETCTFCIDSNFKQAASGQACKSVPVITKSKSSPKEYITMIELQRECILPAGKIGWANEVV